MKNTTLCYIQRENQYLMLHRIKKKNDLNQDKWIGVGGKCEENESPEECLLRECWEETGLILTRWRYRGLVTFVSDRWEGEYMHLYTTDRFSGAIGPCSEGVLEWLDKKALRSLQLWSGDHIFLDLLETEAPFFSLKLVYEGDLLVQAVLNGRALALPYAGPEALADLV